jgi:Rad3-related DNA helicase
VIESIITQASEPRETQIKLARFLDDWHVGRRHVAAVQADTGTGKSRVLLAAAIDAVRAGNNVVISVSTVALAGQMAREARLFDAAGLKIGRRFGMRSFMSASRIGTAEGRLVVRGAATEEELAVLRQLKAFSREGSGLIDDWLEQVGELPCGIRPDDIALLPSARAADKAAYLRARGEAAELDVPIQTHALTLTQARAGEVPKLIIFDEADALAEIADNSEDRRLSLRELEGTLAIAEAPSEALAALVKLRANPNDLARREALAGQLSFRHGDEEVRWALSDARRILTAHRLEGRRRGTEVVVSDRDVIIRSLWADRAFWTWRNLRDGGCQRAIFASATLSLSGNPADGLRVLGVAPADASDITVPVRRFGTTTFRLIENTVPEPITKGRGVNALWREAAATFIAPALEAGRRALVLTTSYDDAEWLADRFHIRAQRRGELLGRLAEEMRAWRLMTLVTPAGWVGLDQPGLFTDVVIWRLPFEAPDELRASLAGQPTFQRALDKMLRRLRQGFGRGIRQATDEVTVWLADPRLHNRRLGVQRAVPERFRAAWMAALAGTAIKTTMTPVRPEQAAFRDAVLKADGYRCVITGCDAVAALEAAHRPGRDWKLGHNRADDGWTLRADLHRLLDEGLLKIRDGNAWFVEAVRESYFDFHGRAIASRVGE